MLTAGHCVVNTDSGETISGMQYWPAFNGNDEPFDPITVSATRVLSRFANQTTVSTASLNYDFALLTLSTAAPSGTAELAIAAGTGEQYYDLTTAGYPGTYPALHTCAAHALQLASLFALDPVCHLQVVTLVTKVTVLICMICLHGCDDRVQGTLVLTLYLLVAQETRPQAPCGPQTAPRSFLTLMGLTWRWVCTAFIPLQSCLHSW